MDSTANLRNERPHWICCQIGAREHYAIPRAMLGRGSDVTLLTDVWSTDGCRWLLPQKWKQRCHPDIPDRCVRGWTFESLLRSVRSRLAGRSGWKEILERNEWFQRRASAVVEEICRTASHPPVVFSYSYSAREIFRTAKRHGCTTILGQMDPAEVEVDLVRQIEERHGTGRSEWPPGSYWDHWHEECELADHIVVNSEWSRSALLQQQIDEPKIKVISLAYEKPSSSATLPDLPVRFTAERPLRILFLGQVILRKGIAELAAAAEQLHNHPVHWHIVGSGAPDLLMQLSGIPSVSVAGQISRAEVRQEYERADVFILPTHSDGFALTQLEAAAYGLPIIASQRCGDVVDDGQNGLILSNVSAEAIVSAVHQFLEAPELVARLRANQMSRKLFDIDMLGRSLETLDAETNNGGVTPCST